MQTAALIVNPVAGRGGGEVAALRDALATRFRVTVCETTPERDADVCAREALAGAPDVLVVAGGDGTVSLAASAVIETPTVLGIVPRGTSNSIATALGIPGDEAGALQTIFDGEPHTFDSARANGRAMLLHASVGLHAAAVTETARDAKNRWGMLAYVERAIAKLGELEPFHVEIETENEIVRCRAVNVTVANVAPLKTVLAQGPAEVAPDDGQLDVTIVAASSLASAVAAGLHLLRTAAFHQAATRDDVGYLRARHLRIDSDPAQPLLVDGEAAGEGRLVITCLPQSVRVLVPRGAQTAPSAPEPPKLEGLPELELDPK